jgi:hypothetical protein
MGRTDKLYTSNLYIKLVTMPIYKCKRCGIRSESDEIFSNCRSCKSVDNRRYRDKKKLFQACANDIDNVRSISQCYDEKIKTLKENIESSSEITLRRNHQYDILMDRYHIMEKRETSVRDATAEKDLTIKSLEEQLIEVNRSISSKEDILSSLNNEVKDYISRVYDLENIVKELTLENNLLKEENDILNNKVLSLEVNIKNITHNRRYIDKNIALVPKSSPKVPMRRSSSLGVKKFCKEENKYTMSSSQSYPYIPKMKSTIRDNKQMLPLVGHPLTKADFTMNIPLIIVDYGYLDISPLNSKQIERRLCDLSRGLSHPISYYLDQKDIAKDFICTPLVLTLKQKEVRDSDEMRGIKKDDICYTSITDDLFDKEILSSEELIRKEYNEKKDFFSLTFNAGMPEYKKIKEENNPHKTERPFNHVSTIPGTDKNLPIPIIMGKHVPGDRTAKLIMNVPISDTWNESQIFAYGWLSVDGSRCKTERMFDANGDHKFINYLKRYECVMERREKGIYEKVTRNKINRECINISLFMGEYNPKIESFDEASKRLEAGVRYIFNRFFYKLYIDEEEGDILNVAFKCDAIKKIDGKFFITKEPFGKYLIPTEEVLAPIEFNPSPDPIFHKWMVNNNDNEEYEDYEDYEDDGEGHDEIDLVDLLKDS